MPARVRRDDSAVSQLMAALCREKNQLSECLNAIADQIEEETELLSKKLLTILSLERMAEKERVVKLLQDVTPFTFTTFSLHSANRENPDSHQLTHSPISALSLFKRCCRRTT